MDARMLELLELPAIAQPPTEVNPIAPAGPPFLLVAGFLHLKFTEVFIPQRYFANPRDLKVRENCIPQFLTQHVSSIDLRLNLLSPIVEEFCNLVQCRLNQRRDWKTEDPLQDSVHAFGEMDAVHPPLTTTLCVLVACLHQQCPDHPIPELGVQTTLSSPGMSTVLNDITVPGMACWTTAIQPSSLLYEATQLPYTRAMAFCFPRHVFLYETVKPLAFFTVSTTSEMGMSAFSITKPAITLTIMSESSFGWSFAITVDEHLWGPSYLEIIHN
ncbi:uncharacterized protein G2W53_001507 [Senna tora]|uniref:Uncharacterized protein n=1 Tax=Senna tora TaxID=362788 RepID=A0A834XGF0_9FABA|nr:uncharacterized protein G2W53_001507 [Senna tora]